MNVRGMHKWVWLACALGSIVACGAVERVSVGAMERVLDLETCQGDRILCELEPMVAAKPVSWRRDEEVRSCVPVEGTPWRVASWLALDGIDCAALGRCDLTEVAISADGTIWAAGLGHAQTEAGIFLAHFDRDGSMIAGRVLETRRMETFRASEHRLSLAAGASGHAYVAVAWNETSPGEDRVATTAWIGEYDARVRAAGVRIPLRGVRSNTLLALRATDALFLVASEIGPRPSRADRSTRVAKLAPGLETIWVQTNGLPNADPLATLASGGAYALVEAGWTNWASGMVSCYGDEGNVTALLSLPQGAQPFGLDARGELLTLQNPTSPIPTITRINRTGSSGSPTALVRPGDTGAQGEDFAPATALDSTGTAYLIRPVNLEGPFEARLFTLDSTGRECTAAAVSDESLRSRAQPISSLWVTEHGDIYLRVSSAIARLVQ